jgi:hypothetical protein
MRASIARILQFFRPRHNEFASRAGPNRNARPGNAILQNGVMQTANLEIGVPGLQPQVLQSTSEFRFNANSPKGIILMFAICSLSCILDP